MRLDATEQHIESRVSNKASLVSIDDYKEASRKNSTKPEPTSGIIEFSNVKTLLKEDNPLAHLTNERSDNGAGAYQKPIGIVKDPFAVQKTDGNDKHRFEDPTMPLIHLHKEHQIEEPTRPFIHLHKEHKTEFPKETFKPLCREPNSEEVSPKLHPHKTEQPSQGDTPLRPGKQENPDDKPQTIKELHEKIMHRLRLCQPIMYDDSSS